MKTKKIVLTAIAAALVASVAAPSFAAPGRDGPGRHGGRATTEVMFVRLLKTADANKDGKITKEEVMAHHDSLFAEADGDKDGSLTPGELRAFRKAKFEEFRENNPRPERAERREKREERRKEMAENGDTRGDREERGPGHRWGKHGPRMGGMHLIRMADTDENGQLSKEETIAAVDKLFARMDKNKDGVISIDDMPDRPF